MPLEDFLFPGESIRYQCRKEITYAKNPYVLYITDRRVLGHKRKGLIFKKDQVFSAALEEIRNLKYHEEGIVRKKVFQDLVESVKEAGRIHRGERPLRSSKERSRHSRNQSRRSVMGGGTVLPSRDVLKLTG